MSRVVVIGGSGHVGTYLVPALVEQGHDVVNVSRGQATGYRRHVAWSKVEQVSVDRTMEERAGRFARRILNFGRLRSHRRTGLGADIELEGLEKNGETESSSARLCAKKFKFALEKRSVQSEFLWMPVLLHGPQHRNS
jgi:hypothetical protein